MRYYTIFDKIIFQNLREKKKKKKLTPWRRTSNAVRNIW